MKSSDGAVAAAAPAGPATGRRFSRKLAAFMRWLHIYLSMFGLAALLFFSVTGITLNHPEWFEAGPESTVEAQGRIRPEWLGFGSSSPESVKKLEIVEHLRSAHGVRGPLADFRVDDQECSASFKGTGYAADAFIERETGEYRLTVTQHGLASILNDLHKGRDSGKVWSWVIDLSAGVLSAASLTGLILLLYIKRRRRLGLLTGCLGALVLATIAYFVVP